MNAFSVMINKGNSFRWTCLQSIHAHTHVYYHNIVDERRDNLNTHVLFMLNYIIRISRITCV